MGDLKKSAQVFSISKQGLVILLATKELRVFFSAKRKGGAGALDVHGVPSLGGTIGMSLN